MPLDNVVPIDAQTARILEQRTTRFRWFVAGVATLWLALLVPVLLFTPLPPLVPFVVLALLVVLAEHQFVLFGDETSMSASIIVVVGSIFVFADSAPLAAPMLIASLGGLYLPHLRDRAYALVLANSAIYSVAAAIGAALVSRTTHTGHSHTAAIVLAGVAAATAYWYSNSVLTGVAAATRNSTSMLDSVRVQAQSEWPVLFLAAAAAVTAQIYFDSEVAVAATTACLLLVFQLHVHKRSSGTDSLRGHASSIAAIVGVGSMLLGDGSLAAAVACVAAFYLASRCTTVGLGWSSQFLFALSAIAAASIAMALAELDQGPGIKFLTSTVVAFVGFTLAEVRGYEQRTGRRIQFMAKLGLVIPSTPELATFAAAAIGVLVINSVLPRPFVAIAALLIIVERWVRPAQGPQRTFCTARPISDPEIEVDVSR